jgi:hypothetical protein
MEAVNGGKVLEKEAENVLACSNCVVLMMQSLTERHGSMRPDCFDKELFKGLVRTLQMALDLLEEDAASLMRKLTNQPLRPIVHRLVDSSDPEEVIAIVGMLNSYAESSRGSLHLFSENLLTHLAKNPLLARVRLVEFYTQDATKAETRNPVHILWCQVLLLIRTLNGRLLEEGLDGVPANDPVLQVAANFSPAAVIKNELSFFNSLGAFHRFNYILSGPQSDSPLSQAYFEEA